VQGTEAAADGHAEGRRRWLIASDPTQRLDFDIAAVARPGDEWTLNNGLCER
jgi:hypothetical protein